MKRFVLVFALLAASACAHLQTKQTATISLQSVDTALGAAQDFEQSAYANRTISGLTPALHQQIAALFAKAFDAEIQAATILKAWKAGDPYPSSLTELQGDVDQALVLARQILTSPAQQTLLADIQAVADTVLSVVNTVKGGA